MAGFVRRGGSSPELGVDVDGDEDVVEDGVEAGVLFPEGAETGAVVDAVGFLVKRGGASELSIPTGADSAGRIPFFPVSVPAGTQAPVASHGMGALTALLWRAVFTVKSPRELPVRSAS